MVDEVPTIRTPFETVIRTLASAESRCGFSFSVLGPDIYGRAVLAPGDLPFISAMEDKDRTRVLEARQRRDHVEALCAELERTSTAPCLGSRPGYALVSERRPDLPSAYRDVKARDRDREKARAKNPVTKKIEAEPDLFRGRG